ncbi:methyltransferase, FxLD system [Kribbella italica]|uniref:Protein-L-isoaspartate O-methyltransferase n=1 Tax=Kribbella italica TaxID=1540520 RepID=A0A7W9J661_9ACTN|nr:methyltransferase, FxLD system [Kribbella italica]MBB5836094.1 protein-L-isoaspartate(D-aspartate) O-methyltransferase [Kribbella italica]
MDAVGNDSEYAGALRAGLVVGLREQGALSDERVAAAFGAVPRHVFIPEVSVETAYADDVVLMKQNAAGIAISSVSQPSIVALMLQQAGVEPGHRVLEIGSGGYNAALLWELAKPDGEVTTIDIDPDVTDRASATLQSAGYEQVKVVRTDGIEGWKPHAPYDRIVVTVTANDIAPAWVEQLATSGRIVVPLRVRGQTRSLALDLQADGTLESRSSVICGFVEMQGTGAAHERAVQVAGEDVVLRIDADQEIDQPALDGAGFVRWTRVLMDREEPFCQLDLWLASVFEEYCVMSAGRAAVKKRLVRPALRWGGAAVVRDGTLAYLTSQPGPQRNLIEVGVRAHGPAAVLLAEEVAGQVRAWDAVRRGKPDPVFLVHPAGTTDLPAGPHFRTRNTVVTPIWTE